MSQNGHEKAQTKAKWGWAGNRDQHKQAHTQAATSKLSRHKWVGASTMGMDKWWEWMQCKWEASKHKDDNSTGVQMDAHKWGGWHEFAWVMDQCEWEWVYKWEGPAQAMGRYKQE